ncbi:MAG: ABC transporter permease [Burkholderiaceae bacterium]
MPDESNPGASAAIAEQIQPRAKSERWLETFGLRSSGVIYALVVVLALLVVLSAMDGRPFYLRPTNFANLMEQTALLGIIAVGMALLLISGSFDLSVGSMAALSAIVAAMVTNAFGPLAGILAGLATGALGGLVNGLLHWIVGLNPFIVTLGTLSAYRGLALVVSDGRTVALTDPSNSAFLHDYLGGYFPEFNLPLALGIVMVCGAFVASRLSGQRLIGHLSLYFGIALIAVGIFADYSIRISISSGIWLLLTTIAWIGLSFTSFGRRLRATGADSKAARMVGVRIKYYKVVPFVIVGTLAGMAGVLLVSRLGAVDPNVFTAGELTVIAAAVVGGVSLFGGTGSVAKTACGAFLLFAINNGLNILNVSSNYQLLVAGVIILASASLYVLSDRRSRDI